MALKSVGVMTSFFRRMCSKPTTNGGILPKITNRNPRNLERLRLANKPKGYALENFDVEYWHKLIFIKSQKFITAQIVYNTGKVVVEASTKEWAFKKHLYSLNDKQAYIALAKIFSERCLECGMYCFVNDIKPSTEDSNLCEFLKILQEEGLTLEEPEVFNIYDIWRKPREKRPWTVLED